MVIDGVMGISVYSRIYLSAIILASISSSVDDNCQPMTGAFAGGIARMKAERMVSSGHADKNELYPSSFLISND